VFQAIYLRVSTTGQTVENQKRELEEAGERHGWEVILLKDAGYSGANGGDQRPGLIVSWIAMQAEHTLQPSGLPLLGTAPHLGSVYTFRLMARHKYRSIPFSYAGRQLEARAVPVAGRWAIWIYENNRALTCYKFIEMQTVEDAERYNLDLLGDELNVTIEAVKARQLILLAS
jgi:hypothetical protein